jgi:hypothetical protein
MQNRLYNQRTKQILNEGKAISDEGLIALLNRDKAIKYAEGALQETDLGHPGGSALAVDQDAYQQFLQEYMNDVIQMIGQQGQPYETPKPGLENKYYYY